MRKRKLVIKKDTVRTLDLEAAWGGTGGSIPSGPRTIGFTNCNACHLSDVC